MTTANVGIAFVQYNIQLTLAQVVFERLYPKDYTPAVATRVSNSLLVGPCSVCISSATALPKHTFV
jgi:hypothetical protein